MIGVEINKDQVREILNKANPRYVNESVKALIGRMGARGRVLSVHYLEPTNPSHGTGYAQKSMQYNVKEMTATVFSKMPERRVASIEEGRAPGELVGIKALARWYDGNLYWSRSSVSSERDRPVLDAAYRIRVAIKRSGARGKQFISQSREKLQNDLPTELGKIAKSIEKRWGK